MILSEALPVKGTPRNKTAFDFEVRDRWIKITRRDGKEGWMGKSMPQNNAPCNFLKSVCAYNFFCATSTRTHLYIGWCAYRMMRIKYVPKTYLKGHFVVRSEFSCVRSSHDLCARAHAHSLEGTLPQRWDNHWLRGIDASGASASNGFRRSHIGTCTEAEKKGGHTEKMKRTKRVDSEWWRMRSQSRVGARPNWDLGTKLRPLNCIEAYVQREVQ